MLSTELPDEQWIIKSLGKQVILNGGGTMVCFMPSITFSRFSATSTGGQMRRNMCLKHQSDMEIGQIGRPFMYRDIYRTIT